MKSKLLLALACWFCNGQLALATADTPRARRNLDLGWRFTLGEVTNAFTPSFDDRSWRKLDLPHDWAIEGPFAETNLSGRTGGYAPLGIGWYRRPFLLPAADAGKRVLVEFDGVFAQADVWLNGQKLARHDFGYLGFQRDLTPHVKFGGTNVLAVRVENSRQASRWYTGSGIYRHVWLDVMSPLHVAHWGTYVTTSNVTEKTASVRLRTTLKNASTSAKECVLVTKILDHGGQVVAAVESWQNVPAEAEAEIPQDFAVARPQLWSPETPHLYRAVSEVREGSRLADTYETPFGIRTIKFDPDTGFALNGRKVVLKGVCIHHDNGALGAAALDRVVERRLEVLKAVGCNAIRLSHNPHAPELLDLCDRLGLLVIDEAFDKWSGFTPGDESWRQNLRDFIARDRNHPSVVLWSVGNEVKEQLKPEGLALMKSMAAFVHDFEPTRPVTAALHPGRNPGLALPEMAQAMDVVSLNYSTQLYEDDRRAHPNLIILGSETLPYYTLNQRRTNDVNKYLPGNSWFAVKDYVAGQFIWAGIDYLGESTGWPARGWTTSPIDTCGFRKDFSYYQQSLYSEAPVVFITVYDPAGGDVAGKAGWGWPRTAPHWNWPATNQTLKVATFANCPTVELFLNDQSLGEKQPADFPDRIITWEVTNQPGTLRAIGRKDGQVVSTHELETAGPPAKLALLPDRRRIKADGQDLVHLEVNLVDAHGVLVPNADRLISFEVKGPGKLIAVDNGDLSSDESYQAHQRTTRAGKCLAVLRSSVDAGVIEVSATAPGLPASAITIETVAASEKQITHGPGGRVLANTGVWSPDGEWIVFDTRGDAAGEVFAGQTIQRVNVRTGEVSEVYRSQNGAHCGVPIFHPRENKVVFILGPENPTPDWQYGPFHRQGVIVKADSSAVPVKTTNLDARDLTPPFTPGALRGGSHVHVWDDAGDWVSYTYEDHVLAQFTNATPTNDINLRNIGVSIPAPPVRVDHDHPRNHDGDYFSVIVTRTTAQPRPGSDEIKKAFEEAWVGTNGYLRADGTRQRRALAFQGHVVSTNHETFAEVFIADLPDDLTQPGADPIAGTETRMPGPPRGCAQRRLSFTADRKYPGLQGPRHWLRSSPDGARIACLMKDDAGVVQLWTVSPNGGPPTQITHNPWNIASTFTWGPDGKLVAHVMDNSVCVTDIASGQTRRLTARTDDVSAPRPEACVFSPDGKRVAYLRRLPEGGQSANQIFVVGVEPPVNP